MRFVHLGIALTSVMLFAAVAKADTTRTECSVTGSGTIESGDAFAGNATPIDPTVTGAATGVWEHVTTDGRYFQGAVDMLRCRRDGGNLPDHPIVNANLADFSGTGTFEGVPVTFRVHVEDRGEGKDKSLDFESIRIFDANFTIVYAAGGVLQSGNVQFHPAR